MRDSAGVPPSNWWQRASKAQTYAVVLGASAGLFLLLAASDTMTKRHPQGYLYSILADAGVAILSGALISRAIRESQARYRAILRRLEMIAEMNHHIRNALDLIQLSAHTTQNAELIAHIESAAGRIQWALREILPQATKGREARH